MCSSLAATPVNTHSDGRIVSPADMRSYTGLMVMWYLMTSCTDVSSVPGFRFTVRKLHQAAPLACEGKCPGALLWIRIQKPGGDVEVARCDQTSCSSVEGFIISHEQYLQGNFSLTITAADYRRRGWYTCSCDGQGLCDVPERVKVMFNRSSAEGLSSVSVPLCEVEGRKAQCDAEYEKRVKFECSLILHEAPPPLLYTSEAPPPLLCTSEAPPPLLYTSEAPPPLLYTSEAPPISCSTPQKPRPSAAPHLRSPAPQLLHQNFPVTCLNVSELLELFLLPVFLCGGNFCCTVKSEIRNWLR
ncbi:hypothetical protein HF521_014987 [Silurus meridionalis]|uniref:Uncharacterized protein n=1 Tax=Silurus meridionalis TaxID=175797 RepID=A0A8T0A941_SILME|nr:hypothetical protein HF521_014987 [Silurus meridionalis]